MYSLFETVAVNTHPALDLFAGTIAGVYYVLS